MENVQIYTKKYRCEKTIQLCIKYMEKRKIYQEKNPSKTLAIYFQRTQTPPPEYYEPKVRQFLTFYKILEKNTS